MPNFTPARDYRSLRAPVRKQRIQWASPVAQEAFNYGPAPLCLSGGFGAAKTVTAVQKILYISDLFPGNRGVIARRVGDELRKTTVPSFFKYCPPEAYIYGRRADQEKILQLNPQMCDDGVLRKSEVLFLHLDDTDIQTVLRGLEINWFLLDQAEEMEEQTFTTLMKRLGRWDQAHVPRWLIDQCRSEGREWPWWNSPDGKPGPGYKPIPPTYPMMTVNPDIETHWVYRLFHEESDEWQNRTRALGYKMFTMNPLDNKFLPAQNRAELLAADPEWQERFVYGKWGATSGQIHKVAPESIVEGTPEILEWIRAHCTLHRSMDHGDAAPTCCLWWGTDDSGNVYAYREYYRPNALISEHRQNIHDLSEGERYTFNLADPSIFSPTMQKNGGRWSVADEYADTVGLPAHTAIFWARGDNSESKNDFGSRNRISEYLRVDPDRIHPFTKKRGSPRLFLIKRTESYPWGCNHAIRELRSQRRLKVGSENGKDIYSDERDPDVPDHAYDPTRYFIASRPPLHVAVRSVSLRGTAIEARRQLKRVARRGKLGRGPFGRGARASRLQ